MKTVFDNRQLAHVWAQQKQPEGRGSHMFFDGASIFSYGRHFEIARFVTRHKRRAVLVTTRSYSISTSRHVEYVRGALYQLGVPVHYVASIDDAARGADAMHEYYKVRMADALAAAGKARKADLVRMHYERAAGAAADGNAYARWAGRRWRFTAPEMSPQHLDELRHKERAAANRARAAKAAREAADSAKHAERVIDWRNGERVALGGFGYDHPTMLRVNGDEVETSRGARVPVEAARLALLLIGRMRSQKTAWAPAEGAPLFHIGAFTLDAIDPDGNIIAGCHRIEWPELEACGKTLGVFK